MKRYIYGIDFGTTNSALSILDIDNNKIIKTFSEASILFFIQQPDSRKVITYVGQPAIEAYLANRSSGRFMKSVKRVLPRTSFTGTTVYGKKYTASDLVTFILAYLKGKADEYLGQTIEDVILGRPVYFDEDPVKDKMAQDRLEKAARKVGFHHLSFQMEPIAAAFAYERTLSRDETVLVADIGGGTSDFTVMKLGPGKYKHRNRQGDMLAQGGIYIGGDSFDSAFMVKALSPYFGRELQYESAPGKMLDIPNVLYDSISSWEKMNFINVPKLVNEIERYYFFTGKDRKLMDLITLVQENLSYSIFREIERSKIDLSAREQTTFHFDKGGICIDKEVSIDNYNRIIGGHIDKIGRYLDEFLIRNSIAVGSIDTIFITGGSAQVKAIKKLLEDRFGTDKVRAGDFLNSVSHGLAWSYYG